MKYDLTDEEMFAAIRSIEPTFYIYRGINYPKDRSKSYHACGVANTSRNTFYATPEDCLHGEFDRYARGEQCTAKYETFRWDNGKFVLVPKKPIETFSDNKEALA